MNNKNLFRFREGCLLLGSRTYIMGIINVTPDSFSDGGDNLNPQDAINTAVNMEKMGADILDIGGQSTRPGHTVISADEEWVRLKEVLPLILKKTSLPVSVDTYYPEVAEKSLEIGCHIINDVSGNVNPEMIRVVKKYSAGIVLMHSGEERTGDIVESVGTKLNKMLDTAIKMGIDKEYICLDPGIGFFKDTKENFCLIKETNRCKVDGVAYLVGASRKRFLASAINDPALSIKNRDIATVAVNTAAILGGADIIRVHNVEAAVSGAKTADAILKRKEF